MIPVNSSNIAALDFQENTLIVLFHSGLTYYYHKVPEEVYNELLNSESIGKYLNTNIKKTYSYSMPIKQERSEKI